MAATTISVEEDQFCCSVCLEILRDPVTIPCGHSYCLECIEDFWSRSKQKGQQCSCPQCRQVFHPRPALSRNTVLGELVEKLGQGRRAKTGTGTGTEPVVVKSEEVKCDVCVGKKAKAVKSCLVCAESYCGAHLRAHDELFRGKAHKLGPAAARPGPERLCPLHRRAPRLFCRTDQQLVCSQCVKERHKGHDTVTTAEERAALQKKIESSLKSAQRLKDVEKELRYVVRYIKHSTEAAVEESERTFAKLVRIIEKHNEEVKEQIRAQEKAAVGQAEELLAKVQRELGEIRRSEAELERLSHSDDHVLFLQKCRSLHIPAKAVEMPSTDAIQYAMYKTMRGALADLRDSLNDMLEKDYDRISDKVSSLKEISQSAPPNSKAKNAELSHSSDPRTRAEFLQYYHNIILDPNTANPFLSLSDDGRAVTTRSDPQPYQNHPDRFTSWAQVLCKAGMTGRCYWEVEWSGSGGASVGICYRSMSRSGGGSDCKLGHNSKSWSLDCSHSACSFQHDKDCVAAAKPCGSRIGLYLDFRGGTLSFYNVSDSMVLLHKVRTAFTQPVYPGFWVGLGSTLKLCSLKAAS